MTYAIGLKARSGHDLTLSLFLTLALTLTLTLTLILTLTLTLTPTRRTARVLQRGCPLRSGDARAG